MAAFDDYIANHPGSGDAWAYLQSLLDSYGLGTLTDFAQNAIVQGFSATEVIQRVRTTDAYKQRFKVIEDRRAAGLPAISEAEVISYEKQATQMLRAAGMPEGFYDSPDDFYKFQLNDISLAELDARINKGYVAAMQMPQDVRDEAKTLYGLGEGDLAAFFLDPDRTEAAITERFGATQRAAEAFRTGYGQLSVEQAERLQKLGVGDATQGFTQLASERELFHSLPGEADNLITREQQLAAQFEGNATAQQAIKRVGQQRVAAFSGGGDFAQNKEGFAGIGTAR